VDLPQLAAILASVLIAGVALFQVALAAGAPYGEAVLGGKAPTDGGVLAPAFRALALVQAVVLVLLAGILLARAGIIATTIVSMGTLGWLTWVAFGFLALNTAANLSAPHPIERWGMGSTTLVLSGLTLAIALGSQPA
jgi:hypothetical protein